MSETITRQIEGVCTSTSQKPGSNWVEYEIDIGKQYPVRLSTSKDDVKALVASVGAQKAVWTFSESDGNPNPHKPGSFYKNRWVSNVEVGGSLDPALAGQMSMSVAPVSGGVQAGQMPSAEGREISIERQSLIKAVLPLLEKIPEAGTETGDLLGFLDKLDDWMGRERKGDKSAAAEQAQAQAAPAPDPDPAPENPDDEIPF